MNTYLVLVAASHFDRPEPDYWHVESAESAQAATAATCRWLVERKLIPDGAEPAEYLRDVVRAPESCLYVAHSDAGFEGAFADLASAEAYAAELRDKLALRTETRGRP